MTITYNLEFFDFENFFLCYLKVKFLGLRRWMAQLLKSLFHRPEDLSSDLQCPWHVPVMTASAVQAEMADPWGLLASRASWGSKAQVQGSRVENVEEEGLGRWFSR